MTRSGSGYSAPRDANRVPFLLAASSSDGITPVVVEADPTSHALLTSAASAADIFPAIQNITVQDLATSTVSGFNGQSYIIGTPTSGSAATYILNSIATVAIQITGLWTGTLRIEASVDGGITYSSKFSRLPGTVYAGSSAPTANCLLLAATSNYNRIRVRSSATMTGTAVIMVSESVNEHLIDVLNPIRLLDSTTNTLMTIKPASIAPIATDTSIVVTESPNSPAATSALQTSGNTSLSSIATAQTRTTTPFGIFGTSVAVSVKASAGNITAIHASNANAAIRYLQVFNKASAPAGGDVPIHSWPITASGGSLLIGTDFFGVNGAAATLGIAIGVSTTNATFTAATAADHNINGMYY